MAARFSTLPSLSSHSHTQPCPKSIANRWVFLIVVSKFCVFVCVSALFFPNGTTSFIAAQPVWFWLHDVCHQLIRPRFGISVQLNRSQSTAHATVTLFVFGEKGMHSVIFAQNFECAHCSICKCHPRFLTTSIRVQAIIFIYFVLHTLFITSPCIHHSLASHRTVFIFPMCCVCVSI